MLLQTWHADAEAICTLLVMQAVLQTRIIILDKRTIEVKVLNADSKALYNRVNLIFFVFVPDKKKDKLI